MSRTHHSGAQPSQRMLRVAELVRHALANLIARGVLNDPVIETHVVTVPRVKMSPDLKLATAYVMPLGGKDVDEVLAALERHRKFLRAEVAHQVNLRYAPDVRFKADSSFENAARIDALLRTPEVKRDLDKKDEAN
jgi:ribosome-binding factor A